MEHLTTQELAKAIQAPPQIPWVILGDAALFIILTGEAMLPFLLA